MVPTEVYAIAVFLFGLEHRRLSFSEASDGLRADFFRRATGVIRALAKEGFTVSPTPPQTVGGE